MKNNEILVPFEKVGEIVCYLMETGATETHAELEETGMYRVTWEVPDNGVQGL